MFSVYKTNYNQRNKSVCISEQLTGFNVKKIAAAGLDRSCKL